jgi:hypothetical protein
MLLRFQQHVCIAPGTGRSFQRFFGGSSHPGRGKHGSTASPVHRRSRTCNRPTRSTNTSESITTSPDLGLSDSPAR